MLKKGLKLYSYHTFLVIPFIVLFLYAHNQEQTRLFMTYRTLWIGLLTTGVLFGATYLILRNRLKTGVFVTLLLFMLFQYGVIYEFFEALYYAGRWPWKNIHRYIILCYLILTAGTLLYFKRSAHDFIKINYFLNFLLGLLIIFNLAKINFRHYTDRERVSLSGEITSKPVQFAANSEKPNIYLIILDGYANNDVLRKYYDFDNVDFTNELKGMGFRFCDSAFSNYYYTAESLASSLNMDYLNDSVKKASMVFDNLVFKSLKANQYKIISLYSGYAITAAFKTCDSIVQIDAPREFEKSILRYTILRLDDVFGLFAHQRLSSQFKKMYEFVKIKTTPRFCFLHFVAPHPPFIFDRNGNITTSHKFAEHSWEPKEMYVDQLIYVNKEISALIHKIELADPEAVIILQSDHGPWATLKSKEDVFEARSRILYAYRVGNKVNIPSKTSSVNTFRYLFNGLFDTGLDTLEDLYRGKALLLNDPILNKKVE